jgi:hypothetical protein
VTILKLTGWEKGIQTVSLIAAIREHGDVSLSKAKKQVEDLLGGEMVEIEFADPERMESFRRVALNLGARCEWNTIGFRRVSCLARMHLFWANVHPSMRNMAGETRLCHFRLAPSRNASPRFPFTVCLRSSYSDLDPTNNAATVILSEAAKPVPALNFPLLVGLAVTLGWIGFLAIVSANGGDRSLEFRKDQRG